MPLATPVIALVGFFSFVGNWNNYFLPFSASSADSKIPVQVGLAEPALERAGRSTRRRCVEHRHPAADARARDAARRWRPILIIFLFAQRFLVAGMTAGGTKE